MDCISSIIRVQMLMYMCKLHVKCQSHEFFDCLQLDCEFQKLLLKLRIHHFKKFAPRENNPLYIRYLVVYNLGQTLSTLIEDMVTKNKPSTSVLT